MPTLDPSTHPPVRFGPDATGTPAAGPVRDPDIYADRHCLACTGTVWRIAGEGEGYISREAAEAAWAARVAEAKGGKA